MAAARGGRLLSVAVLFRGKTEECESPGSSLSLFVRSWNTDDDEARDNTGCDVSAFNKENPSLLDDFDIGTEKLPEEDKDR